MMCPQLLVPAGPRRGKSAALVTPEGTTSTAILPTPRPSPNQPATGAAAGQPRQPQQLLYWSLQFSFVGGWGQRPPFEEYIVEALLESPAPRGTREKLRGRGK